MSYLNQRVFDRGLEVLVQDTHRIALTIEAPTDWQSADDATVGTTWTPQAVVSIWGPDDPPPLVTGPSNALGGRKVTVGPVVNGVVVREGVATHWALLDDVSERLLASAPLALSISLTPDSPVFTLTQFDIVMPGA